MRGGEGGNRTGRAVSVVRIVLGTAVAAGFLRSAAPAAGGEAEDYVASVRKWQAERLKRLDSDTGWLTIAGFYWLKAGDNAFGSDSSNAVVLPVGPARAGTIHVVEGEGGVRIDIGPADGTALTLNSQPVTGRTPFYEEGGEEIVAGLGRVAFWIIPRAGTFAVRIRDPESPLRKSFPGIDTYPIDPAYRVQGRLEARPRQVLVPNIMGYEDSLLTPGPVRFTLGGETVELFPVIEDAADTVLFFIFEDATSGIETYGGGRFLYSGLRPDGTAVLDFNKAYNPPCALNPFATCPLPPAENRLSVAVRAGEKRIAGSGH